MATVPFTWVGLGAGVVLTVLSGCGAGAAPEPHGTVEAGYSGDGPVDLGRTLEVAGESRPVFDVASSHRDAGSLEIRVDQPVPFDLRHDGAQALAEVVDDGEVDVPRVCLPLGCAELERSCGVWPDSCGGSTDCGGCPEGPGWKCNSEGQCECTPGCQGKQCGADGCGASCGACTDVDPCTQDVCKNGLCAHTPVTCPPDVACQPGPCEVLRFVPELQLYEVIDTCMAGNACQIARCDPIALKCVIEQKPCPAGPLCMENVCSTVDGECYPVPQDCNDDDPLTTDECIPDPLIASTGICIHRPSLQCDSDEDCPDYDNPCSPTNCSTGGLCVRGNDPPPFNESLCCEANADCLGLGNSNQVFFCGPFVCQSYWQPCFCSEDFVCPSDPESCVQGACVDCFCRQTWMPGCCLQDADCEDSEACTLESCDTTGKSCEVTSVCFSDSDPCTMDLCTPGTGQKGYIDSCTAADAEVAALGVGDLVLTEVWSGLAGASDSEAWVEVRNLAAHSVQLLGVGIGADDGAPFVVSDSMVLPPGALAVLGRVHGKDPLEIRFFCLLPDFTLLGDELVRLLAPDGTQLDSIALSWGSQSSWVPRSMNLDPAFYHPELNDLPQAWCQSTIPMGLPNSATQFGSPGTENTRCDAGDSQ